MLVSHNSGKPNVLFGKYENYIPLKGKCHLKKVLSQESYIIGYWLYHFFFLGHPTPLKKLREIIEV